MAGGFTNQNFIFLLPFLLWLTLSGHFAPPLHFAQTSVILPVGTGIACAPDETTVSWCCRRWCG